MKTLAKLIQKNRDFLSQNALQNLRELVQRKKYILSENAGKKVVAEIIQAIAKGLSVKNKKSDAQVAKYFIKVLGNNYPFKVDRYEMELLLFAIRKSFCEWIQNSIFPVKENQAKYCNKINEIVEDASLNITKHCNSVISNFEKDNTELIKKLKIVKDDQQQQLNAMYQMIKSSPIGVAVCNKDFIVSFWSPMAVRITGYQQSDILQQSLLKIFSVKSNEQFLQKIKTDEKRIHRFKLIIKNKMGGEFQGFVSVNKIRYDEDNHFQYVVNFIDITKDEMIRNQVQKIDQLSAISRFSDSIMHDIRNPVNSIGLNIDVLTQMLEENGRSATNTHEVMEKINRQFNHLKNTLNQYKGYSRLTETKFEEIDLLNFFSLLIADAKNLVKDKGIVIKYIEPKQEIIISGDVILLNRAFTNIILNAIEAVYEKTGIIQIKIKKSGNRIGISITDNGKGISRNDIKKIYMPYYTTKLSGVGLGLFIVKEIIRSHSGRIYCSSGKNIGTRFTVSLPFIKF